MVEMLVVLGGALAGAGLGLAAFRLPASDDDGNWRGAGARIRTAAVAAVAAVSAAAAGLAWVLAPSPQVGVMVAGFAAASPGLAVIDIATRRLPFPVLGAVAAVALAGLAFTPVLASSVLAAAVAAAVFAGLAIVLPRSFTAGDVAAAAVVALTLAWAGALVAALGLLLGLFMVSTTRLTAVLTGAGRLPAPMPEPVPLALGPFLVAGWWSAFLYSI